MLISICYLVIKGLLQSNTTGGSKLMDFLDEQRMCRLYERFILEYYRKEHPEIKASASQIPWQLDDDFDSMLPIMQTDRVPLPQGYSIHCLVQFPETCFNLIIIHVVCIIVCFVQKGQDGIAIAKIRRFIGDIAVKIINKFLCCHT